MNRVVKKCTLSSAGAEFHAFKRAWCTKQNYLPYNPFDKLKLKKLKDEGGGYKSATIEDIQRVLKRLNKHN